MAKWFRHTSGAGDRTINTPGVQRLNKGSSWISHAERDPISNRTIVTFNDGFQWVGEMSDEMWNNFSGSSSLGRWWHSQKGNSSFWSKR